MHVIKQEDDTSTVRFEVSDTGSGIKVQDRKKIILDKMEMKKRSDIRNYLKEGKFDDSPED